MSGPGSWAREPWAEELARRLVRVKMAVINTADVREHLAQFRKSYSLEMSQILPKITVRQVFHGDVRTGCSMWLRFQSVYSAVPRNAEEGAVIEFILPGSPNVAIASMTTGKRFIKMERVLLSQTQVVSLDLCMMHEMDEPLPAQHARAKCNGETLVLILACRRKGPKFRLPPELWAYAHEFVWDWKKI